MQVLKNDRSFFFDVDDTLIMWYDNGITWEPHTKHVDMLKKAKIRGQFVVVWSAGGYEWAEKAVKMLKLEKYVDIVMSKPDWWVDDLPADKVLSKHGEIYLPHTFTLTNDDGTVTVIEGLKN